MVSTGGCGGRDIQKDFHDCLRLLLHDIAADPFLPEGFPMFQRRRELESELGAIGRYTPPAAFRQNHPLHRQHNFRE